MSLTPQASPQLPRIVFTSRNSWKIFLAILAVPAVSLGLGYYLRSWHHDFWVLGCIVAAIAAVAIPLFTVPSRCIVNADNLVIQYGVIKERIPLARIKGVILTGPPDVKIVRRVRIMLDSGHRFVSPKSRVEFIRELKARAYL